MRDQWVGDRRDYMKYFILRNLAEHLPIRVCWMLWREEMISYLSPDERERHEGLDDVLYAALAEIVGKSTRTTEAVEDKVFGDNKKNVSFFRQPFGGNRNSREQYFRGLLDEAQPGELLFFDPDTGLEPDGGDSGKHLRWRELDLVVAEGSGHSLAVYQHRVRQRSDAFRVAQLKECLPKFEVFGLYSREVNDAAFLIAARPEDAEKLKSGAENAQRAWNRWAEGRSKGEPRHTLDHIVSE